MKIIPTSEIMLHINLNKEVALNVLSANLNKTNEEFEKSQIDKIDAWFLIKTPTYKIRNIWLMNIYSLTIRDEWVSNWSEVKITCTYGFDQKKIRIYIISIIIISIFLWISDILNLLIFILLISIPLIIVPKLIFKTNVRLFSEELVRIFNKWSTLKTDYIP